MRASVKVVLSQAAAALIQTEAPMSADDRETGGILLGHDLGDTLSVKHAGGPGPHAERHVHAFLRDLSHARRLADDVYEIDGSVWLGEWHTHPDGPSAPSPTDLTTYTLLLADAELGFERLLSVVVTPCAEHGWAEVSASAWVIDGEGAHAVEMQVDSGTLS